MLTIGLGHQTNSVWNQFTSTKGGGDANGHFKFEFNKKELDVVTNSGKIGVFIEKAAELLIGKGSIGSNQTKI